MQVKHTPGPWEFRAHPYAIADTGDYDCSMTIAAGGKDFVQLFGSDDEDEANARLIAAAPELLEALQNLDANPELTSAWLQARAAIKKALGDV